MRCKISPKDVGFENHDEGHLKSPDTIKNEWDCHYSDDPERDLIKRVETEPPYPKDSTLSERIEMRKARIVENTTLVHTLYGVRPA